jgi:hypothetical protein
MVVIYDFVSWSEMLGDEDYPAVFFVSVDLG